MSLRTLLVLGVMIVVAQPAAAARTRFHLTPDPAGNGCLRVPAVGERLTLTGWKPYNFPPPRATQVVSFRHPATGKTVAVPLSLPAATPRMGYSSDRVTYNYGSDTVEVQFLPDGSAYVFYDSGLLRAP